MMLVAEAPIDAKSRAEALYHPDDSDKDLRQDTSYGNNGRWSMGSVLKWRYGGRDHFWMFSCYSLLFFSSLDLGPVQMASGRVFSTCHWRWSFPMRRIHRKVTLSGIDRLWDLWVRTIAYVKRLFDCSLSVSFLSYSCTGLCSPGGLHLKKGIM